MSRSSRARRTKQRTRRGHRISIALALCVLILIPMLSIPIGGFVALAAILSDLPEIDAIDKVQNWQTTKIYAADGTLLTDLYYEQDRIVVPLSEIPKHLQQAVIAIEDERFYKHHGYDLEAIGRAFVSNLESGEVVEGASTITQQYIKNTIINRDKTFDRKIKEAALAYQLEKKYSKDQILEKYLNTIYFGQSWYGVETASLNFFGKRAKDLTLSESTLLAAIIKSPKHYSPYTHPKEAKARRDTVLKKMAKLKFISTGRARQAMAVPVQLKPQGKTPTVAPYFVEYVKQFLIDKYDENVVFKGGLRVYTTIDLKMQQHANEATWSTLNRPNDPSAALVAIEPQTGYIRAMIGGRNFDKKKYNLATQGHRQPGSAFKTFVFTAAIEEGMSPFETYQSSPVVIKIPGSTPWKVNNYVEGSGGPPMTIREALVRSVNTVYARLIMDVGADKVANLAMKMGILSKVNPNPAIALGGLTHGTNPLEMASAYGTLANGGRYCKPTAITKITEATGKVIAEHKINPEQVINEATAYIVTDTLQDVVLHGTGTRSRISRPSAGKTGTGQEYRDAWFCGYTPELSTTIWVGYPEEQVSMKNVHGIRVAGGTFPAQIWAKFMSKALQGKPVQDFSKPKDGITNVLVCAESGQLVNKYCVEVESRPFLSKKAPDKKCKLHTKPSIIEIPNVVGLTEREAAHKLDEVHFGHSVVYKVDDQVRRGKVISQIPSGGERAVQDTVIQLEVSTGMAEEKIRVPNVVELTEAKARQKLEGLGLKVIDVTSAPYVKSRNKRNRVVSQSPEPDAELQYGQAVTIHVNRKK